MNTNETEQTSPAGEQPKAPGLPEDMLIILPVRNLVMFPGIVLPVAIKREKTVAGAQEAVRAEAKVGFLLQKDPQTDDPGFDDLHRIGSVASVMRSRTSSAASGSPGSRSSRRARHNVAPDASVLAISK